MELVEKKIFGIPLFVWVLGLILSIFCSIANFGFYYYFSKRMDQYLANPTIIKVVEQPSKTDFEPPTLASNSSKVSTISGRRK